MNIYIDCEWSDDQLISMALVSDSGDDFYEVLECKSPNEWVRANVIPVLNKAPISEAEFKSKLKLYLHKFKSKTIIADWPNDIAWFCNSITYPQGLRFGGDISFELVDIKSSSKILHNALEDAKANKLAYCL